MRRARYPFATLLLCSLTLLAAGQTQLAKLTASHGAPGDGFGTAIAAQGKVTVIGAPSRTVGQNIQQGAAYVYVEPSGGWANATQRATLTATDGVAYDLFGLAVALDNGTVVVGAPTRALTADHGAVYVFVRSAGSFKQVAKLTASDGFAGDGLGSSVAVRGNTIMAGAVQVPVNGSNSAGATYVFVEPPGGWADATETAKLTTSDSQVGGFVGSSLSFKEDTLVVGGVGATFAGKAYVYVEPAGGWTSTTETAKLSPSDGSVNDFFGSSVSLCGGTILVGSPGHRNGRGAGYIFVKPSTGWVNATENAKLIASDGHAFDSLGTSVSLVGGTALMGAPGVSFGTVTGKAYVYLEPAGGWKTTSSFHARLKAADRSPTDLFGTAVVLNGTTDFVGAPAAHYSGGSSGPGAAYVFGP